MDQKAFMAFQSLGCKDRVKCALGARIFADLQLDGKYDSLDKCYDESLDVAYVRAQDLDKNPVFVLFLLSQHDLDLRYVGKFQRKYLETTEKSKLVLAICDTSNILYYNVGHQFMNKLC